MSTHRPAVIVTGSSGFIGAAIVDALADRYDVAGLDQAPPHKSAPGRWIEMDVTDDASVRAALARVFEEHGPSIAAVVHLAAYYDFSGQESPLYEQVTVRGTERLLSTLRELAFDVGQLVFSSTMLVHAPCEPGQHIDEEWPLDPKWNYPKSKVEAERIMTTARGEAAVVLLRIAGVYDDRCHSIPIAHQMQRIYERRPTGKVFPGDASTGQAYVHLDDLVDAVRRTVDRRETLAPETVLLIGEPEPLSYDESQRMFGWLIHEEEWETRRIPKAVAKTGAWVQDKIPGIEDPFIKPWMIDLADDHYALDITRARKLLDWKPAHTLRETLPRMVEFLKQDPSGFYRENKLKGSPPSTEEPATLAAQESAV